MFAALAHAKVMGVAAAAVVGLAFAAHPAEARNFHPRIGVDVVFTQPVYTAPVVVAAPACPAPVVAAPACPAPVAVAQAPVYVPGPTVVYTQPYYAPTPYVVVDRGPHYRFHPLFSFHGGWHR